MAAHPVPIQAVVSKRRVQPLPEIDVLDRLFVGCAPAVLLPTTDPQCNAVAQILTVSVDVDPARPLERFERRDGSHQFHAVVGAVRLAALDLLAVLAEGKDRGPAPG